MPALQCLQALTPTPCPVYCALLHRALLQLGGPKVMGSNGVSHHIVEDYLAGVACALRWLAYTPARTGEPTPALPSADPATRRLDYLPAEGGWVRWGGWVCFFCFEFMGSTRWPRGRLPKLGQRSCRWPQSPCCYLPA